ncbi:hypothetical protein IFR05_000116 [Cadophora sp. M221]|nr:hypothetical protein IFR05_000116 [Cadophora sp. M221]
MGLLPPPPGAMTPPPALRKRRDRPRRLSSVSLSPAPRMRIPLHTGDFFSQPEAQPLSLPAPTTSATSVNSTVAVGRSNDEVTAAPMDQDTTISGVDSADSEQVESAAGPAALSTQHQEAAAPIEEDSEDMEVEQEDGSSASQQ